MSEKIEIFIDITISEAIKILPNADGTKSHLVTSSANAVCEGDVIARLIPETDPKYNENLPNVIDVDQSSQYKPGTNIEFDSSTREFKATKYGLCVIDDSNTFHVEPLLYTTDNNMEAFVFILRSITGRLPSVDDIRDIIKDNNIMYPYEVGQIRSQLENLVEDGRIGDKIMIAEGTFPKDGKKAYFNLVKKLDLAVGKELENGRIDYKEKESFVKVEEGEVILEKVPEIPPEPGVDIFGKEQPGKLLGENVYHVGRNIVPDELDANQYKARISGVLVIVDNKVHVEDQLLVKGDVNLNTGNVNFEGTVQVTGSVIKGFKVTTTGNVVIGGNVEDAEINAGGDIVVKNGIIGKESFVKAKGNITVKFVQNAQLWTEGNINITENVVQGRAFARDKILVGGSVVGGELIGKMGVEVEAAGTTSEIKTTLITAKDPQVEEELAELNNKLNAMSKDLKEMIDETTLYFGEALLHRPKEILPNLPKNRQIQALTILKKIKAKSGEISEIKASRDELRKLIHFTKIPRIKIKNEAYAEVTIRIRDSVKKIDKKLLAPNFYEDPETKMINWD